MVVHTGNVPPEPVADVAARMSLSRDIAKLSGTRSVALPVRPET
jgi:hypothetical protein